MTIATGRYLIPAVKKLPGLSSFYSGTSTDGSMANVSIWESEKHAQQMDGLKEMVVDARQAAEEAGVTFLPPIVNHSIVWSI